MAKAEALSPTMTHRIWQVYGLQQHRVETFKLSRDPEFVKKLVKKLGRRRWKQASGYHRQGRVKNAFFRYTSIIGEVLRARSPAGQESEAVLGCALLNRMTALGRPKDDP